MKKIQYKIKTKLSLLVVLFISALLGVNAQSNLTNALGITNSDLLKNIPGPVFVNFNQVRTLLAGSNADCFLITADYTNEDFPPIPVGDTQEVYGFKLNGTLIYEIGVKNISGNLRWYIRRPTNIASIGKIVNLDYEIYDDLGVEGRFTFILGHHFTAIAVDDGDNFKLSPIFFGMDSNIGTLESHMGEFTGETSKNYIREVYVHKYSKTWKMSGDAKIATLISRLNANKENIVNARATNTKKKILFAQEDGKSLVKNVKLYPNPSNGKFHLNFALKESGSVNFEIFNFKGHKVLEHTGNKFASGNNKYELDATGKLSTGIYTLNVTSSEFSERIILIIK